MGRLGKWPACQVLFPHEQGKAGTRKRDRHLGARDGTSQSILTGTAMSFTSLLDRVMALWRRNRIEDELNEEIREHIEMATEEYLSRGMSLEEARYAARRSFGSVEQMKEIHREGRGLPRMERMVSDIRFALRSLSRKPGFTITTM